MSRTAIATWLSRPIIVVSRNPSISGLVSHRQTGARRARSHLEHVHVACGLLVPRGAKRGAYGLPERVGDGFGVAPASARHRLEGLDRRVISNVLDAVSQRIGFGDADERHVRIADQLTAPAHGERNRNHAGKTEPTAVGNGALLGADYQRAILVEPPRRHLIDLCRVAGCEPYELPVPAQNHLGDGGAARDLGMLGHMQRHAVYWDQDLRPHPADHVPEFVHPRVPGYMHEMGAVGDDLDALVDEAVDHPRDCLLVTGNCARRKDDAIAA